MAASERDRQGRGVLRPGAGRSPGLVVVLAGLLVFSGFLALHGASTARAGGPPGAGFSLPAPTTERQDQSVRLPSAASAHGPAAPLTPGLPAANSSPAAEVGTVVGTVGVGTTPDGIAFDPLDGYVYVANSGQDTVSVLNGTQVVATLQVGSVPRGVAFNPLNGFVYVTNELSNNISLISGTRVVGAISDPSLKGPCWPAYDPKSGEVYVPNGLPTVNGGGVTIIRGASVDTLVNPGVFSFAAAYDPENGYVYVTNEGSGGPSSGGVTVINGTAVIANLTGNFTNPTGVAYDPQNGYVYVANRDFQLRGGGFITVVRNLSTVARIPVGPEVWSVTYDPISQFVYAAANDVDETLPTLHANSLAVVNGTLVLGYVRVGLEPYASAYDPQNALLYATSGRANAVSAISTALAVGPIAIAPTGHPSGSVDVGRTAWFNATLFAAGNGTGGFDVHWEPTGLLDCGVQISGPPGPLPPGTYGYLCQGTTAGTGTLWLNFSDTSRASVWSRVPFVVFDDPRASTPLPGASSADVGQDLTFQARVTNPGSGGDRLAWNSTPALACATSTTLTLPCVATSPGTNESVYLTITDSNGGSTIVRSAGLIAFPDPQVEPPSLSSSTVSPGDSVTIGTTTTGGSGGLRYVWAGLPSGCTSSSVALTCRPETVGVFRVSVTVNDSNNVSASSGASLLTVKAAPSDTGTILGLPALAFYGLLLVVVAVAWIAALLVRRRRAARSTPRAKEDRPPPPPAGRT